MANEQTLELIVNLLFPFLGLIFHSGPFHCLKSSSTLVLLGWGPLRHAEEMWATGGEVSLPEQGFPSRVPWDPLGSEGWKQLSFRGEECRDLSRWGSLEESHLKVRESRESGFWSQSPSSRKTIPCHQDDPSCETEGEFSPHAFLESTGKKKKKGKEYFPRSGYSTALQANRPEPFSTCHSPGKFQRALLKFLVLPFSLFVLD